MGSKVRMWDEGKMPVCLCIHWDRNHVSIWTSWDSKVRCAIEFMNTGNFKLIYTLNGDPS